MTQEEAIARFIRAVWECLMNAQILMELKKDLIGSSGRDSYVSKPSKRQQRAYQKGSTQLFCEPRIIVQSVEEGRVARITIEVQNLHVCHESMRDLLKISFSRSWDEALRFQGNPGSDTIWTDALTTASSILIHYLRARQACRECMIESQRLERKAIKFARLTIDAANGN